LFQFGYRVGEFGGTEDCGRHRAGAADGIDQVVVRHRVAGGQLDGAGGRVDAGGAVDHQVDVVAEQGPVVGDGVVVSCDQLVQPDPLDELCAGVDQCDDDAVPLGKSVGGHHAGVSAADDDDAGLGFCHVSLLGSSGSR
jgi:hypothetical protein